MTHLIETRRDGGVVTWTLSNPPHHTLTATGVARLHGLLDELEKDPSVRVLVLTGGGEGVFVAHYDVGELAAAAERGLQAETQGQAPTSPAPQAERLHAFHRLCLRLEALPAVTVAAINGHAAGGGLELALACDFRLAMDGSFRLGLPETNVGIIPGAGGTQRLARLIGKARALDLILHGQLIAPARALEWGIVHRVFAQPSFADEAQRFAQHLAKRAPMALAAAKQAIHRGLQSVSLPEALAIEQACFDRALASEDAAGAMRAWLSGKQWVWQGR